MTNIKISKSEQFYHENLTWKRSLDFFKDENSFLKNRLSKVVDERVDKEFLELAEHFQNQFILNDEYINSLLKEINIQEKKLKEIILASVALPNKIICNKQILLRNEIELIENNFTKLKNEFNKYLVSIL